MDCSKIVIELIEYFKQGYERDLWDFFSRSDDEIRKSLREKYFDEYRKDKDYNSNDSHPRPKTTDFISAVRLKVLLDLAQKRKIDFSASNGSIHDPNDLVGRSLEDLGRLGYGYLIDMRNGREKIT